MKLPKTLLAAIVVGIAVTTVTSCSKDDAPPKPVPENPQPPKPLPWDCPACGLG